MRTWSPQQQAIFSWFKSGAGNLVVRARAGTGKTTTILEGIGHAPEPKILLAAFNKSIATELQGKLKSKSATAQTLHSVGFGFVRDNWQGVKVDADRGERMVRLAIEAVCPDLGSADVTRKTVTTIKKLVSLAKGAAPHATLEKLEELAVEYDCMPEAEAEKAGWTLRQVCAVAHEAMELALEPEDDDMGQLSIDFDDMLFVPVRKGWVSGRFNLVVIDEAQDMNATQILLARRVCKAGGRIVVVGDDRQAIYGFRGADSGSIDRLKSELAAEELGLTVTYRCPKKVVERAQALVADFSAAPEAPEGVVSNLHHDKLVGNASPGDFVLSRKNAPLAQVCLALLKANKKARIQGRDIGKGLTALVRKLRARSIAEFLGKLQSWTDKEITRAEKTGTKSKNRVEFLKDQEEMLVALCEGLTGPAELEARIENLFVDDEGRFEGVLCSSIHRAKGLEAHKVFLLVDTLYPGGRTEIEEENLEYVGITRAKHELVLVFQKEAA